MYKRQLKRYFAAAAKAREILVEDPSAWELIKTRLNLKDEATSEIYRQRYREGVPKRPLADEAADARTLYSVLAEVGGAKLVGEAKVLDLGLFYDPKSGE